MGSPWFPRNKMTMQMSENGVLAGWKSEHRALAGWKRLSNCRCSKWYLAKARVGIFLRGNKSKLNGQRDSRVLGASHSVRREGFYSAPNADVMTANAQCTEREHLLCLVELCELLLAFETMVSYWAECKKSNATSRAPAGVQKYTQWWGKMCKCGCGENNWTSA